MLPSDKHIILIGFKHVGKSVIGKEIAMRLHKEHVDLDTQMERRYAKTRGEALTCRQIMQREGQALFRELEHEALQEVIAFPAAVISVGGGTPLDERNQTLMKAHRIVHVLAPRGVVFERIMVNGRPAFFSTEEDPYVSFKRLWREREKIYTRLTSISVYNNGSIELAADQLLKTLDQDG